MSQLQLIQNKKVTTFASRYEHLIVRGKSGQNRFLNFLSLDMYNLKFCNSYAHFFFENRSFSMKKRGFEAHFFFENRSCSTKNRDSAVHFVFENRSFSIVADVAQKMEPDVLAPRAFLKRIFVSPDLQLIDSLHLLWTLHDSKRLVGLTPLLNEDLRAQRECDRQKPRELVAALILAS